MDLKGQYDCERYFMYMMWIATGVSFVSGLAADSIQVMFGLLGAAFVICLILCLPEWKAYNANPLKFQSAHPAAEDAKADATSADAKTDATASETSTR